MGKKSVTTTYLLWLFGGFLGLHHLYLGRDAQAFVWWCTIGGYLGCGWLRDIFHIPEYVADANDDENILKKHVEMLRKHDKPPYSTIRFLGMIVVAYLWGSVVMLAIPYEEVGGLNWQWMYIFAPLACALGVWTVGNIGWETGSIWWCLITAYATYPLYYYLWLDDSQWLTVMTFCSALVFDTKSKQWRRTPPKKKSLKRRLAVLCVCGAIYLSLWGSFLYFNGTIVDSEGESIPVSEAIHHFFTSPWWVDLQQSLYDTWTFAQHNGWAETWKQIIDLSDPHGELNAYKVLEVTNRASQSEITAKWRALSREWHPDKVKDPEKKLAAQEKFMEIQQAYEILSSIKNRRQRLNKKFDAE